MSKHKAEEQWGWEGEAGGGGRTWPAFQHPCFVVLWLWKCIISRRVVISYFKEHKVSLSQTSPSASSHFSQTVPRCCTRGTRYGQRKLEPVLMLSWSWIYPGLFSHGITGGEGGEQLCSPAMLFSVILFSTLNFLLFAVLFSLLRFAVY